MTGYPLVDRYRELLKKGGHAYGGKLKSEEFIFYRNSRNRGYIAYDVKKVNGNLRPVSKFVEGDVYVKGEYEFLSSGLFVFDENTSLEYVTLPEDWLEEEILMFERIGNDKYFIMDYECHGYIYHNDELLELNIDFTETTVIVFYKYHDDYGFVTVTDKMTWWTYKESYFDCIDIPISTTVILDVIPKAIKKNKEEIIYEGIYLDVEGRVIEFSHTILDNKLKDNNSVLFKEQVVFIKPFITDSNYFIIYGIMKNNRIVIEADTFKLELKHDILDIAFYKNGIQVIVDDDKKELLVIEENENEYIE